MKQFLYLSIMLWLTVLALNSYSNNSDQRLNELIDSIGGGGIDDEIHEIAQIAASGNARALQILRDFREHPKPSKWKLFKDNYGYPVNASDTASMSFRPDNLQIALSIAGDEKAWLEITKEFEKVSEIENVITRARARDHVLDKIAKVGTPKAITFVASQLDRNDLHESVPGRAAERLRKMVPHLEADRIWASHSNPERYKQHTQFWRDWWARNKARYEKAIAEGLPVVEADIASPPLDNLKPPGISSQEQGKPAMTSGPIAPSQPVTKWHLWIIGGLIVLVASYWGFMRTKNRS